MKRQSLSIILLYLNARKACEEERKYGVFF